MFVDVRVEGEGEGEYVCDGERWRNALTRYPVKLLVLEGMINYVRKSITPVRRITINALSVLLRITSPLTKKSMIIVDTR